MFCKHCGYEMIEGLIICPNCLKNIEEVKQIKIENPRKKERKRRKGLSDGLILLLGLYPKDEGYKASLIVRILNSL